MTLLFAGGGHVLNQDHLQDLVPAHHTGTSNVGFVFSSGNSNINQQWV